VVTSLAESSKNIPRKRYDKVHIEISNICNLQCSFCPEVVRTKKLISLELFEKIVQQVSPLTEQIAFHLMGDPLVHPQLSQLVDISQKYHAKIFFVTNGVLLTEERAELLLHPAFRQVNFSLHSFFDNFKDKDPGQYLAKVFNYTEKALEQAPEKYINFRLWNLQDVRGSSDSNRDMLKRISERFDTELPQNFDVRDRKSFRIKGRLYLHFDTEFIWPDLHLPVLGSVGTCYGLKSHFGILVDGTVVPCCLDKEGAIALGNISNSSLQDILESERAQAIFKGFQNRKLIEPLCQRCQYIDRFGRPHAERSQRLQKETKMSTAQLQTFQVESLT
jgi:radical SAM protein with 4Fe4S-binding SPASM domain